MKSVIIWKLAKFRTPDGGSIKKTDCVVGLQLTWSKKLVITCAFWLESTLNYHNFWICGWIFCLNKQILIFYMDDQNFFSMRTYSIRYKYQSSSTGFQYKLWICTPPLAQIRTGFGSTGSCRSGSVSWYDRSPAGENFGVWICITNVFFSITINLQIICQYPKVLVTWVELSCKE